MKTLELLPLRSTYNFVNSNGYIVTELEGGFSRTRLDFIENSQKVKVSWDLSPSDYEYFQAFFIAGVNDGADWFNIDLILNTKTAQTCVAKFVEGSVKLDNFTGLKYMVSAMLEVRPNDNDAYLESVVDSV